MKNSSANFCLRLRDSPLWHSSLDLSYEKCASMMLVVLGMPLPMWSYHVGRLLHADDLVSHRQEGAYALDAHGHRLRLHEVPQQILARQCVLEQHHPEVAPPVCRVHDHHDPSRSVDSCHRPVPVYLPLDGLGRAAVLVRQLGACLPQRHVFLPKALAA